MDIPTGRASTHFDGKLRNFTAPSASFFGSVTCQVASAKFLPDTEVYGNLVLRALPDTQVKLTLPKDFTIYGNATFDDIDLRDVRSLRISGDAVFRNVPSPLVGKNTHVSSDVYFKKSGIVELDRSFTAGGRITTDDHTALLIHTSQESTLRFEAEKARVYYFDKNSTLEDLLDGFRANGDLFPDARKTAKAILRRCKIEALTSCFRSAPKIESFSANIQDTANSNIHLRETAGLPKRCSFVNDVYINGNVLSVLPKALTTNKTLRLERCTKLTEITQESQITASAIIIKDCPNLTRIDSNFITNSLTIENCPNLRSVRSASNILSVSIKDCPSFSPFNFLNTDKFWNVETDMSVYYPQDTENALFNTPTKLVRSNAYLRHLRPFCTLHSGPLPPFSEPKDLLRSVHGPAFIEDLTVLCEDGTAREETPQIIAKIEKILTGKASERMKVANTLIPEIPEETLRTILEKTTTRTTVDELTAMMRTAKVPRVLNQTLTLLSDTDESALGRSRQHLLRLLVHQIVEDEAHQQAQKVSQQTAPIKI